MVQLTIALDEETLEKARARAQERGTSLDDLLRGYLEAYVAGSGPSEAQRRAVKDLLDLSAEVKGGSGGRRWTRDELYER
jgi:hypothetical protein